MIKLIGDYAVLVPNAPVPPPKPMLIPSHHVESEIVEPCQLAWKTYLNVERYTHYLGVKQTEMRKRKKDSGFKLTRGIVCKESGARATQLKDAIQGLPFRSDMIDKLAIFLGCNPSELYLFVKE